jgi:1,4-alpha-glucan branching enzyme
LRAFKNHDIGRIRYVELDSKGKLDMWQGGWNMTRETCRRLPIGAEILPTGGTHFRVWADRIESVSVAIVGDGAGTVRAECALQPEGEGYFSAFVGEAKAGDLYSFRLNGQPDLLPTFTRFAWTASRICFPTPPPGSSLGGRSPRHNS